MHAIGLTLVRLAVTKRRLLEWETAAASAERGRERNSAQAFVIAMIASPLAALVGLVLVVLARPAALATAAPVLVLWAAAPLLALALSRPVPERRQELALEGRAFLERIARATWRYFDDFMAAEDNALPPDNVQETSQRVVAHRTSPTNIGMGLLATLAAHDFGFIDTDVLASRIDATLTTIEGLERHEGHLLNWYDTQSLAPLLPRYVSTVDSGNLAGALMALAEGLREAGLERAGPPGRGFRRGHELPLPATTRSGGSCRSATAWPTRKARAASTTRTTTCSPPRRAWRASSPSRAATCRRRTGSTWAGW